MRWLPSLFAAEAIPSAMITFVALLMFLQLGIGWEMSTLYCALLTLPWMMKSWVRQSLRRWGHYVAQIRCAEVGSLFCLVALAFSFTAQANRKEWVLLCLFVLCVCSAWHELVSRMYYEERLRRPLQRYYRVAKMSFTQAAVVLTYGVMIVAVGSLEVFFHNYPYVFVRSWSVAVYLLAGVYLLVMLWNLWAVREGATPVSLDSPPALPAREGAVTFNADGKAASQTHSAPSLARLEETLDPSRTGRAGGESGMAKAVSSLFFLLLPQALLFHTRVLYLFASQGEGGLGCSLQEIGLAQGTVGVIAFSVGLILGHALTAYRAAAIPTLQVLAIGFSPVVYWLMTQFPPENLWWLCAATATAQLCFGFGLNACTPFLRRLFGERYADTINYLYVPLICLVMLPAMAASGYLVSFWGFERFFALDALLAIPAWIVGFIYLSHHFNNS